MNKRPVTGGWLLWFCVVVVFELSLLTPSLFKSGNEQFVKDI